MILLQTFMFNYRPAGQPTSNINKQIISHKPYVYNPPFF